MQTKSDAMQPCKLYFAERGIGSRVGTAAGDDTRKEEEKKKGKRKGKRKKERSKVKQLQRARKGVQR